MNFQWNVVNVFNSYHLSNDTLYFDTKNIYTKILPWNVREGI